MFGVNKGVEAKHSDLPGFVTNRDTVNVPELLENKVGGASRYTCDYWATHVRFSLSPPTDNDHTTRLITSATESLKENALPWIEVMGLENRLEDVIRSVNNLPDRLGTVCRLSYD